MFEKEFKNLINKIEEYENIIIAKHFSPDWDTHGSAWGLRELILDNFKGKNVYVTGEQLNVYKREEDESLLNREIVSKSLLITADVANFERIDFEFKNNVKEVFKIDHHLEVDDFAFNKLVDVSAIACTQVITLWAYEEKLKISQRAAKYLYYGLVTDSGRFLYDKTNTKTFRAAKILLQTGININEIYSSLYLKPLEVAKMFMQNFNKAIFCHDNQIAYIKITQDYFQNSSLGEEEIKGTLGVLSGIKEVKIWFLAYQPIGVEHIKISLRSREYDVNQVAKVYNGGGHKLASGAKLKNWEEIEELITSLKKIIDLGEI